MTIDRIRVEFTDEPNVLSVIRKADIDIPTLCYHSELSIYGACRLCTVENERGKTFASCSEPPRDGMVIYTNTPRLMKYRKMILELLLAAHCRDCTTCIKSGECHLQELAHRMGVTHVGYENTKTQYPIDMSSPAIVRDPNKCILCGDCVRMCDNVQSVNAIDFAYRGTEALVTPAFNKNIAETDCVNCGQCRAVCPTGAISINTNIEVIWEALADPNTKVVAQVAPAVRVAVGDFFGMARGENVMGKIVNVLHRMGFDEVFDTAYGADLTVIEESKEFLERLVSGKNLPLFTSCCPAWVSFCENRYPEFKQNLSTCRSPQQMFGAVMKTYFAEKLGVSPDQIFTLSIMPCVAKKGEREMDLFYGEYAGHDVDAVLTTRELVKMIRSAHIRPDTLVEIPGDSPMHAGTGAGVIFGATGGVMEAALRTAYFTLKGENPPADAFRAVRSEGFQENAGVQEAEFAIGDIKLRTAAVSGLGNTRRLLQQIERGEVHYDFVEVMACPGGCVGGGGQPIHDGEERAFARGKKLYELDVESELRYSHENPDIKEIYSDFFGKPMSHKAHMLLHTEHWKNK